MTTRQEIIDRAKRRKAIIERAKQRKLSQPPVPQPKPQEPPLSEAQQPGSTELPPPVAPAAPISQAEPEPEAEAEAPQPRAFGSLFRGAARTYAGGAVLAQEAGLIEPETAASQVRASREFAKQFPPTEDYQKALQDYEANKERWSFSDFLGWMYDNPNAAMSLAGESVGQSAVGYAATAAGALGGAGVAGPAGAVAGATLGAGLTSGAGEYASSLEDFLKQKGFDLGDEKQWANAFANKELMQEAREYAAKRGVAVGAFDALTSLIGARGGGRVIVEAGESLLQKAGKEAALTSTKNTASRTLAEGTVNTGIEAFGGAAGEGTGQLWSEGKITWPDVYLEGALELVASAPEAAIQTIVGQYQQEGTPLKDSDIPAPGGGQGPEPPEEGGPAAERFATPEEARAEGRTFFGIKEEGKDTTGMVGSGPIVVEPMSPSQRVGFEARFASKDPRQQSMFAVSDADPDITAGHPDFVQRPRQSLDMYTFTRPETAEQARSIVERIVSMPTNDVKVDRQRVDLYEQAINLGARLKPSPNTAALWVGSDVTGKRLQPTPRLPYNAGTKDKPIWVDLYQIGNDPNARPIYDFTEDINSGDSRLDEYMDRSVELVDPDLKKLKKDVRYWPEFQAKMFKVLQSKGFGGLTANSQEANFQGKNSSSLWGMMAKEGLIKIKPNAGMRSGKLSVVDADGNDIGMQYKTNALSDTPGTNASPHMAPMGYNVTWGTIPAQLEDIMVYKSPRLATDNLKNQTADAIVKLYTKMKERFDLPQDLAVIFSENAGDAATVASAMGLDPKRMANLIKKLDPRSNDYSGTFIAIAGNQAIIVLDSSNSAVDLFKVAVHEFGHFLSWSKFSSLDLRLQAQIFGAYQRFLLSSDMTRKSRIDHFMRRRMAPREGIFASRDIWAARVAGKPNYYLNFEEWFAEQVARWGMTSRYPMSDMAKFFKALAKHIIKLLQETRKLFYGESFRPEFEMETWLDSMYSGEVQAEWGASARGTMETRSKGKNAKTLRAQTVPFQAETKHIADVTMEYAPTPPGGLGGPPPTPPAGTPPISASSLNTQLDKANWFTKMFLNFRQVAKINQHIPEVQNFAFYVEQAQLDANRVMAGAEERLRDFKMLRKFKGQMEALTNLVFELNDMTYLSQTERASGVRRWPTQSEFNAMVRRLDVRQEALAVYTRLRDDFTKSLQRMYDLRIRDAMKINDPLLQLAARGQADEMFRNLSSAPYFPMTRFGKFAVTVRNSNGKVEHFETRESQREARSLAEDLEQQFPSGSGWAITLSALPEDVGQFQGMPQWYLDKLLGMPGLSPAQQGWIEMLRFELAPSASFKKHLIRRKNRAGFSRDMERVYAQYFFKDARHHARIKWSPDMDEAIKGLRAQHRVEGDVIKRGLLADYLDDIKGEFQNPSRDWSIFRSVSSIWYLGANVASAALNMTQLPVMAAPFLASKFGDKSALKHMTQVMKDLTTYYKRGSYANMNSAEFAAVDMAIKENLITESMAAELAAAAQTGNLNMLSSKAGRVWSEIASKAMWMFQMTEQFNRRITFRSAWRMAKENPGAAWLQEVKRLNYLQYTNLRAGGLNDGDALAYLAGKQAIYDTMYDYSKIARPRFMRGRLGLLFTFYSFTQNTLFTLSQNKDMWVRYALIMTLLAGPMGLVPDDVEDVLNFIGRKAFGNDFNLERQARSFVSEVLGADAPVDALLNGTSRVGFGIPALMDMIGVSWWPSFDRSQSVALNRVLPVGITSILEPGADYNKVLSDTVENVAGAGFGIGFNVLEVLNNDQLSWGDPKRWEKALPRTLKNVTRSFRLATQGAERDRNYNELVPFDSSDPEHVAELIGIAMGYQPTRMSQTYDRINAQREIQAYWTIQRSMLLREAYREKVFKNDDEGFAEVLERIKRFNETAPDKTFTISRETLRRSFSQREKRRVKVESGGTASPAIREQVQKLYPDATAVEKVK